MTTTVTPATPGCGQRVGWLAGPAARGSNAQARLRWRVRGRAGHRVSRQTSRRGSASAHLEDGVKEAATWLKLPLLLGAAAGLCWLTCTWRTLIRCGPRRPCVRRPVSPGVWHRDVTGVMVASRRRGEDAPMPHVHGCRVARFCSADHQKMASQSVASGGSLWTGRHKDICRLLG